MLAIAVSTVVGSSAVASPAAVTVTWSAPATCPTQQAAVERIERMLGSFAQDAPHIEANLAVEHDAATWRLRLAIRNRTATLGERELMGNTCEEVLDAAAVIVALAVHEDAAARAAPIAPSVQAATSPIDATADSAPQRSRQWLAGAVVGGEAGALPGVGPGVGATLAFARPPLRFELAGMFWMSRRAMLASAGGGELEMVAATLRGCRTLGGSRIAACAGLELGSIHSSGVGTMNPMTYWTSWIAPTLGVMGHWQLGRRTALVVHADLAVPARRPHFVILGVDGDVFRPAPVAGRMAIAIERRFW
jgi:hypothetical protein